MTLRFREFGRGATWVDFMVGSYDSKSYELAEYFLQDANPTKERLHDLARHIQQTVEDWCEQNP